MEDEGGVGEVNHPTKVFCRSAVGRLAENN